MNSVIRCKWCESSALMKEYHDREWGVPLHDDNRLFEFILLDTFQAGLSWSTILNKRESFRKAFDNFDPAVIAAYSEEKQESLMQDPGIIRNRLKIKAAITNARAFLATRDEFGTFGNYIWSFVNHKPKINSWKTQQEVPPRSAESDAMSKDLGKRGFKFVGSTICYAFMQAAGMINDHITDCFRYKQVMK